MTIGKRYQEPWPGNRVSKEEMMPHLKRAFDTYSKDGAIHFALTEPGSHRRTDSIFTLRICRYENILNSLKVESAFDGIPGVRSIHSGDLLLGSYNAGHHVQDFASAVYAGVSITFHMDMIRLHYCHFVRQKECSNIYYHLPTPHGGILEHLALALDLLIHGNHSHREEQCRLLVAAIGKQIIHELEIQEKPQQIAKNPFAGKIRDYIDHNYHRQINCTSICRDLRINRSYASSLFMKEFGVNMSDYLLQLRIKAAKYLLESKEQLPLREIASRCAFRETGYFIRVFKQKTGLTPVAYRNQPIAENADKNESSLESQGASLLHF